jgi:hypothetical protein
VFSHTGPKRKRGDWPWPAASLALRVGVNFVCARSRKRRRTEESGGNENAGCRATGSRPRKAPLMPARRIRRVTRAVAPIGSLEKNVAAVITARIGKKRSGVRAPLPGSTDVILNLCALSLRPTLSARARRGGVSPWRSGSYRQPPSTSPCRHPNIPPAPVGRGVTTAPRARVALPLPVAAEEAEAAVAEPGPGQASGPGRPRRRGRRRQVSPCPGRSGSPDRLPA